MRVTPLLLTYLPTLGVKKEKKKISPTLKTEKKKNYFSNRFRFDNASEVICFKLSFRSVDFHYEKFKKYLLMTYILFLSLFSSIPFSLKA